MKLMLNINGLDHSLECDPRLTLLDVLREKLDLVGTKKGCDHGQCGTCTIHIGGKRVLSCLTLAATVDAPVLTIEGVSSACALHPMQAAFLEHDGYQCGYCTSGQIMSAIGCVQEGHANTEDEIRESMSGNLCRCSAYIGIRKAIADGRDRMNLDA